MDELDMSRPGAELFPEQTISNNNSYADVNMGQVVDDPLDMGVNNFDDANQRQLSQKELNFGALREEIAKMKEEREYWKGQAEAFSRKPQQSEPAQIDTFEKLDWEDSRDVRKAFDALRSENENLRHEVKDAITALHTKTQHQDWNNMVSRHVPELTSKNPIFAEMIQKASNPYEAAYLLAELNAKSQAQQPAYPQNVNAQRVIANAQKPQTLASIGGSGTLSNADYYAQWVSASQSTAPRCSTRRSN